MYKVAVWGTGSMGKGIIELVLKKKNLQLVGVLARRKEKEGMDVGEFLGFDKKMGIAIDTCAESFFNREKPDILLHATCSRTREAFPEIENALNHGVNVITLAEEMSFPWYKEPELANKLDQLAKSKGLKILGTGVNPGFVLDLLLITLTGVCHEVKKVHGKRVNDLSPYGPSVMSTQGVGTTLEEFNRGLVDGSIVGHFGFPESICLISKALDWKIDKIEEEREPIISKVYRETAHVKIQPGMVAGCRHIARGYVNGEVKIYLEHPQQVHPHLEGVETGDYLMIEGTPSINFINKPEIPGGIATIALAVNMIPSVIKGSPGILTMPDLPAPYALPNK